MCFALFWLKAGSAQWDCFGLPNRLGLLTAPVRIGNGTLLGPNVQMYCAEHHREAAGRQAGLEIAKPVEIGDNAWIGGSAIILGGVSIGDGAIVGAGAVVTRDVPYNTTVVGNPARPVRRG